MEFNFGLGSAPAGAKRRAASAPMRLLLLGDFSGKPAAERTPLASRPTLRVDVDNIDAVMQKLAPRVALPGLPDGPLHADSLDALHPDSLWQRLDVFAALRKVRQRLLDPAQFAQAAADLGTPVTASAAQGGEDLLAGLLGGRPAGLEARSASVAMSTAVGGVDAFIRSIVAPHIVADTAPQQKHLLASVDAAVAAQMRTVLHAPAWQALEANWRGVQWLIASLELDERLELHLFDVSREELLADIVHAQGRLEQTGVHRALADRRRGQLGADADADSDADANGWSVLAAMYSFGPTDTDIGLLAALGLIASQAGGPLLAGADLALAGAEQQALAGWDALRRSEAAPWIGLVAPRVLLRLPYGRRSDPVSSFDFEEFVGPPVQEHLLWGSGALAAVLLMGRAFSARGWEFAPDDELEIRDLPAYTFLRDGEQELQPCAESVLGEQGGNALLQAGLMPLLSHRHANALTLMGFQSVAEPASPLAGLSHGR